jgi:hypothetical protein
MRIADSGLRNFVRYNNQAVDSIRARGVKVYGKNLWALNDAGANDHGTSDVVVLDSLFQPQAYKFTVTSLSESAIWSRLFQLCCPPSSLAAYDTSKLHTVSFWIKPSLARTRFYIYVGLSGASAGKNLVNIIVDYIPNEWNFYTYSFFPAGTDTVTPNRSLLGFRYLQGDHAGVNLIGQTVEIKEIKLEEGFLSPYSVNAIFV